MCVLKANMSRLLCVYSKHRNGFYVCMTNIEAFTIICETAVTTNQPLKNIANYLALFVHLGAGRGEVEDEEQRKISSCSALIVVNKDQIWTVVKMMNILLWLVIFV